MPSCAKVTSPLKFTVISAPPARDIVPAAEPDEPAVAEVQSVQLTGTAKALPAHKNIAPMHKKHNSFFIFNPALSYEKFRTEKKISPETDVSKISARNFKKMKMKIYEI